MSAMLDWMRAYNARVPAIKKVKFVGFDIHYNDVGKQKILAYLRHVEPERVTATETAQAGRTTLLIFATRQKTKTWSSGLQRHVRCGP